MDNSRGRLPRAAGLCLHSYSLEILPPSSGPGVIDLPGTQAPSFWSSPASTHHVPDSRSEEVYRPLHSSQQPREADTDTPVSRVSQLKVRLLSGGTAEPSPFLPPKAVCWSLSRVPLLVTPWTAARQAPLSTGFSRQEHWGRSHFPLQGKPEGSLTVSLLGLKSSWNIRHSPSPAGPRAAPIPSGPQNT